MLSAFLPLTGADTFAAYILDALGTRHKEADCRSLHRADKTADPVDLAIDAIETAGFPAMAVFAVSFRHCSDEAFL